MRRTNKQIAVDNILENSVSIDKNELNEIKKKMERERIEKLLKKLNK